VRTDDRYWISATWVEKEIGLKGGKDWYRRVKIRFDWVQSQGEPWWDRSGVQEGKLSRTCDPDEPMLDVLACPSEDAGLIGVGKDCSPITSSYEEPTYTQALPTPILLEPLSPMTSTTTSTSFAIVTPPTNSVPLDLGSPQSSTLTQLSDIGSPPPSKLDTGNEDYGAFTYRTNMDMEDQADSVTLGPTSPVPSSYDFDDLYDLSSRSSPGPEVIAGMKEEDYLLADFGSKILQEELPL
jgi:hypothetical protein